VPLDPFLNVVRALAGAELDDPKIRESVFEERIFLDDASICRRFLPTAKMIPPSRGTFRPETRKLRGVNYFRRSSGMPDV
jgi:hypothetical protein